MPAPAARYERITEVAFMITCRSHIRKRHRAEAYEWVRAREEQGHLFVSAHAAVHAWVANQLARRLTDTTPADQSAAPLP